MNVLTTYDDVNQRFSIKRGQYFEKKLGCFWRRIDSTEKSVVSIVGT